jgi:hypothetical protein
MHRYANVNGRRLGALSLSWRQMRCTRFAFTRPEQEVQDLQLGTRADGATRVAQDTVPRWGVGGGDGR